MEYTTYKTFLILCETRSFTETGKRMHVVQSTVSNRIRDLEAHYNKKLFIRENKTVTLTTSGRQLLPYIKRLLDMEREAFDQMQMINEEKQIHIGTFQLAYHSYIKENVLKAGHQNQFIIKIDHSWNLYKALDDHIIDKAYMSYYDRHEKYFLIEELSEPIVHVKSPDYEGRGVIYAPISNAFIEWYDNHYAAYYKVVSIDQSVETIDYILSGLGTGFLPKSIANKYIDCGQLEEIKSSVEPYVHKTYIMCRARDKDRFTSQ